MQLLVFRLDEQRYALSLSAVERVVNAVEVTPMPGAPAIVLGVISVEGTILPVLNLRQRFGLPEREIGLEDHFLITKSGSRLVVFVVDEVQGVLERGDSSVTDAGQVAPDLKHFTGVVEADDGIVLIHDVEKFLSADEARGIAERMDA